MLLYQHLTAFRHTWTIVLLEFIMCIFLLEWKKKYSIVYSDTKTCIAKEVTQLSSARSPDNKCTSSISFKVVVCILV